MADTEPDKNNSEDTQKLGGNIELSGFSEFDRAEMVVIKKIIGNYVRKFIDMEKGVLDVKVTAKPVHEREKSAKYEIHLLINLEEGKPIAVESTGRNAFMVIDEAFKNAEQMLSSE